jgi:hypothetical protein
MRPLVELSTEQYESLMNQAGEALPLQLRLKNAVRTQAGTIAILCDLDEAETLLQVAKQFCPGAMPQLKKRSDLLACLDEAGCVRHTRLILASSL